jgi:hypothetical protein
VHFFTSESEFSGRGAAEATGEDKRHFLAVLHIKFFRRPHELQSKRHLLIHINKFFNSICYQLANKTINLLLAI